MKLIASIKDLKEFNKEYQNEKFVFVPTMGALHQGHLALVKKALTYANKVIVSLFVNPTQFEPTEDFDSYPRDMAADLEKLQSLGVFAVFAPRSNEMFPSSFQSYVFNNNMSKGLCSTTRPHFFQGVCTVLTKLFILIRPQYAVFGKKDYQQLKVVESLVKDLHLDVKIIAHDIIREENGLAMSSRNLYLTNENKNKASLIFKALTAAKNSYCEGEKNAKKIENVAKNILLKEKDFDIDYVELRSSDELKPYAENENIHKPSILFIALKISKVRLIDNMEIGF